MVYYIIIYKNKVRRPLPLIPKRLSFLPLPGGNHCDELHTKLIISYFYYKHLHSHALLFFKDLRINDILLCDM